MVFNKLVLKNINREFKDYLIYFLTLVIAIAIFYVFNALECETSILNLSSSNKEVIEIIINTLSYISIFSSIILGFMIIYANKFFIKKRQYEFGIYILLGMSKYKISKLIFFEILFIGILSLILGIFLGIFISQFMCLIIANIFSVSFDKFAFIFSKYSLIKTLLYFFIIYSIVVIFNIRIIHKRKLIDLLNQNNIMGNYSMKNRFSNILIFIISFGIYCYMYCKFDYLINDFSSLMIFMLLIIIASILFNYSIFDLIIGAGKIFKDFYYKKINSFILSQLKCQFSSMIFFMTLICLVLCFTISFLSCSLSLKNYFDDSLSKFAKVDIELLKEAYTDNVDSVISIEDSLYNLEFNVTKYLKDIIEVRIYYSWLSEVFDAEIIDDNDIKLEFMALSDYNKIAKIYGNKLLVLDDYNFAYITNIEEVFVTKDVMVEFNGKIYKNQYNSSQYGYIHLSVTNDNIGVIVLPDEAFDMLYPNTYMMIANYNDNVIINKFKIEKFVSNLSNHPYAKNTTLEAITKIGLYDASTGMSAMVIFIGLYLGIIFMLSTATILSLKVLLYIYDNQKYYLSLKKIGVTNKLLKNSLYIQVICFFIIPLVLSLINSFFVIKMFNYLLFSIDFKYLIKPIIKTIFMILLIYSGYLILTCIYCKRSTDNLINIRI